MIPSRDIVGRQWPVPLLATVSVLALLFGFAGDGLYISLSLDDLMNLYFGWREPLTRLVVANIAPFTTVYRPAGSALYVALHELFGFDAIFYRAATYAVLLLGCWAVYRTASKLDDRPMAGSLGVIPLAFHSRFMPIYMDNALVYDLLCGMFFVATVMFYHSSRDGGRVLKPLNVAGLYLLWAATINAKEMGLTVAAVLIAYDLVFHRSASWREVIWPPVLLVLSLIAWRCKVAPGSPLYGTDAYRPVLEVTHVLDQVRQQVGEATLASPGGVSLGMLAAVVLGVVIVTFAVRRKAALFGLLWVLITPWPILLAPARGFSAMYVPAMGFAVLMGVVLADVIERLRIPTQVQPAAIVMVALLSAYVQMTDVSRRPSIASSGQQHEPMRGALDGYAALPGLCEANRVLISSSRFGEHYQPVFISRIICDRPTMEVYIPGANILRPDVSRTLDTFDYVVDDDGNQVRNATSDLR